MTTYEDRSDAMRGAVRAMSRAWSVEISDDKLAVLDASALTALLVVIGEAANAQQARSAIQAALQAATQAS